MRINKPLIQLLLDGKFHSGEALARSLKITRSAIWKMIHQFNEIGMNIESVRSKGYRLLNPTSLLNKTLIKNHISSHAKKYLSSLEILEVIDSTNDYLLKKIREKTNSGQVVLAEYQTAGRGRRGRYWHSPFGSNLYMSLSWEFNNDPSELSGLSLVIGVICARVLIEQGATNLQLKWPNDILWNNQKLGGILIEMFAETHSKTRVVIGLGININMPNSNSIDQPWVNLTTVLNDKSLNRNELAGNIISKILTSLTEFQHNGLIPFIKEWQALDFLKDKKVNVETTSRRLHGIAKGITEKGALILIDEQQQTYHLLNGEISIHIL